MSNAVSFRPITPEDEPFLYHVYAGTREEELAPLDWEPSQKEAFLRMQFDAQHTYYQQQFSSARFLVIIAEDQPIGRLYLDWREGEVRVIDIALLAEHRGRGIGTSLLKGIMSEAESRGVAVTAHVERFNRALRLYHRLGFSVVQEGDVYLLLQWSPRPQDGASGGSPEREVG